MHSIVKRLLSLSLFTLLITFSCFVLLRLLPGDPVLTLLNIDELSATPEQIEAARRELGYDQPLLVQYVRWLQDILTLRLGNSLQTGRPVIEMLLESYLVTAELALGGILIALLIALPLGIGSALMTRRSVVRLAHLVSMSGATVPGFWIGLLLVDLFAVRLGWLPVMGREGMTSLVLPALSLGFPLASVYIPLIRLNLRRELNQPYIELARMRGISERTILWRYALRGSLPPVLSVFGLTLGSLAGGVVVLEVLFAYPGVGKLMVDAILQRDYPLIQGYILLTTGIILVLHQGIRSLNRALRPDWQKGTHT
ncbi:ABC transporter permease [Exiguobacterium indicum]|uniref:ABC transporter permease n=1 Tax=Exiguobacterium TaxID=33986 RepID=UPI0003C3E7C4|nr:MULTISPECIES: ABC transporter permease [unclassified Exiguobacterium]AHA29809.1 nickel ABC transporter permease [Exiguobacterium sp. MH3]NTY09572.1 ABC transporter permease [Exiguobacterium sp. JMULE1]